MGDGCDMKGMLSFYILWILSKNPMHGEELAREIEKRRGQKPKAGTIYPALRDLEKKNLVSSRKEGNIIIYTLTKEGKKNLQKSLNYFYAAFGEIFEERTSRKKT